MSLLCQSLKNCGRHNLTYFLLHNFVIRSTVALIQIASQLAKLHAWSLLHTEELKKIETMDIMGIFQEVTFVHIS